MILRPATIDDLPHLLSIDVDNPFAWTAQGHAEALRNPTQRALLAVHGDAALAYAWLSAVGDEGELLDLCVRASCRRSGVARALLAAAEAWWRAAGVTQAFLEVSVANAAAIALYERDGWSPAGRRRAYYRDGTDALIFTRALG